MRFIVEAEMDSAGNIRVSPLRMDIARKYARHMAQMTGHRTYYAFFNEGAEAEDFLKKVPARYLESFKKGWPLRFKVDAWTFGHWLGYDAHEVSL